MYVFYIKLVPILLRWIMYNTARSFRTDHIDSRTATPDDISLSRVLHIYWQRLVGPSWTKSIYIPILRLPDHCNSSNSRRVVLSRRWLRPHHCRLAEITVVVLNNALMSDVNRRHRERWRTGCDKLRVWESNTRWRHIYMRRIVRCREWYKLWQLRLI